MKPVLELLAASALSVGMVIGGVVVASAAFAPDEKQQHHFTGLDIADLWTSEPVRVDRSQQNLERLPPRYASHVVMTEPQPTELADQAKHGNVGSGADGLDFASTSSVMDASTDTRSAALAPQHVSWCKERYRSYDPASNTYRSFSGELRDCASPYEMYNAPEEAGEGRLIAVSSDQTEVAPSMADNQNIRACMERYRSYRVEDNTYQPYGSGPRRQCQIVSF
jgi:hypothetical protein